MKKGRVGGCALHSFLPACEDREKIYGTPGYTHSSLRMIISYVDLFFFFLLPQTSSVLFFLMRRQWLMRKISPDVIFLSFFRFIAVDTKAAVVTLDARCWCWSRPQMIDWHSAAPRWFLGDWHDKTLMTDSQFGLPDAYIRLSLCVWNNPITTIKFPQGLSNKEL